MTLKDMREQPLANILDKMEMVDLKVHSDPKGNIMAIEIKYEPNEGRTDKQYGIT